MLSHNQAQCTLVTLVPPNVTASRRQTSFAGPTAPIFSSLPFSPRCSVRSGRTSRWISRACADRPSTKQRLSAAVVGGGAAGFFTAIILARALRDSGVHASVTIFEASPRTLQKVRLSGGGRCNVTSALHPGDARAFAANYPQGRGRTELLGPLSAWSAVDTVEWFRAEGVALKVEQSGKVFPVSDNSESVVAALHHAAEEADVIVRTRARVMSVKHVPARNGQEPSQLLQYKLHGEDGYRSCDCLCLCTGSASAGHEWARALQHRLIDPVPSLFTFKIANDPRLFGLAGVAVPDATVRIAFPAKDGNSIAPRGRKKVVEDGLVQRGAVLITHWGLSGPAIIQLSSYAARLLHGHSYQAVCLIDFIPSMTLEEKRETIRSARTRLGQRLVHNVCPLRQGAPPNRLWRSLATHAGCDAGLRWADVSNALAESIAQTLHRSEFQVCGKGEFKEEFVTAGGVHTGDISTKSFESKSTPGLFFAGEVLNIDGKTGGYNFQNCWSTGYLAGTAMAHFISQRTRE